MKNPNIAKVLKEYRKQNHYSVEDVVFKLEEQNLPFATKTIYGWESGQTQPDADTLLVLCKIYKIDNILETFGYQPPSEELFLSKEEHELIQKYRQHEEMQNAVKKLLGVGEDQGMKKAAIPQEKLVCDILTPTLTKKFYLTLAYFSTYSILQAVIGVCVCGHILEESE